MAAADDWVARTAAQVETEGERRYPGEVPTCASGISPSGPVHLGNLRELMTPHLVADEVRRNGAPRVPVGQPGELCARGYLVMRGYHDAPEATAAAIDAEGWYHTGDLASLDARGYLRIEGRIKDMIIRGGENIYPREIEDALFAHPGVAEAVVVGVPDQTWGEVVAAFVRPVPGRPAPAPGDLRAWCRERLAPYKTPLHWVFTDAFPTTPSGKIQKYKLRESFTG